MATIPQPSLFSWTQLDTASDLDRLRLVLAALPDEGLVCFLEEHRGRGRDDYPVRPMWNAVIAGIVFQHPSAAALIRELWRNGELRQLCGFDPLAGMAAAPTEDAFGRFLALLVEHRQRLVKIFHGLFDQLAHELPDLGQRLAVDSKGLRSAGRPVRDAQQQRDPDGRRDLDADWGTKTYKGQRADGTAWDKVIRWFGYKLHLVVDSTHELPLGFKLTKASTGDSSELLPLVAELKQPHASVAERAEELAADKAYAAAANKAHLYDDYGIKPIIDHRQLWKEAPGQPRSLCGDRVDVFLYDELGRIYCQCPAEQRGADEVRALAFVGFDHDRQTRKYRCPAAYYGCTCQGRAECDRLAPTGVGDHGRILRVPLETDRRIFTPIARHTRTWETAYDRRTAVERVNSGLDRVLGFEEHFIRGQAKMATRVTLALIVMLAMALMAHAGQPGRADALADRTRPSRRMSLVAIRR
jgi:Transposase DDE domain/Transposase domain (DUF772)